jgi:hypothetical protein
MYPTVNVHNIVSKSWKKRATENPAIIRQAFEEESMSHKQEFQQKIPY